MKIKVILKEGRAMLYGGEYLEPQQLEIAQKIVQSRAHLLRDYQPVSLKHLAMSVRQLSKEPEVQSQAETLELLGKISESAMAAPVRMHRAPIAFSRRAGEEIADRGVHA